MVGLTTGTSVQPWVGIPDRRLIIPLLSSPNLAEMSLKLRAELSWSEILLVRVAFKLVRAVFEPTSP